MEAPTRPGGLPASPRSPVLSEISMILPDGDKPRSLSPSPQQRPPSPPNFYAHKNRSARTITLGSVPQGRREPSLHISSPPLSSQSSRSTLRNMGDSAAAPNRVPHPYDDALASSPTVDETLLRPHTSDWQAQQRRLSSGSTSTINSDDLEDMRKRWPGFDSHAGFDDSGVDLEDDDDEKDPFPIAETDHEPWSGRNDDDDSSYSSDLYSRRAELILANAKKRLNVMEGNLRGARQSLVLSPTHASKMSTELSQQISAARERDRRLYAGIGPIPPRNRAYHSSPLSPNSPSHMRGASETSVPLPFSSPSYMSRTLSQNKRAASAMGQTSGPWSPEGYGQGRFPIRESRSFEVMRERSNGGWDDQDHPLRSHSRGSRSPPNALETLPEDGTPQLHHSASATSSLRDQMEDLKGRISGLKMRAQEDQMKRRSMQSLRAPSPFTSAETWYAASDAYKSGGSPITANAGVGIVTQSPTKKTMFEEDEESAIIPRGNTSPADPYGAVKAVDHGYGLPATDDYQDASQDSMDQLASLGYDDILEPEEEQEEEKEFGSAEDDHAETGGSSVYEDAVYEMPVAERHEDRVDAFDYEHFFLHSAMGTYSQARRASTSSDDSADSVATTRPVTAVQQQEDETAAKRVSYHQRSDSTDSVSTVASFATAAEEQWDDDEENEQMDQFSQQILAIQPMASRARQDSYRSDSAINMRKANGSPSQTSQTSRGSSPAGDLANGLQTSKIFSVMLETPRDEPRLALSEEEKHLIYGLSSSFHQVCANLQSTSGDRYERKQWRRRLDLARRILNGEDFEGEPF